MNVYFSPIVSTVDVNECIFYVGSIERFHSRDYYPYWFTETKESICIKIEFNSQRFSLGHQLGRCDVM